MSNLYMRRPTTPDVVEAEQVGPGAQAHPQGSRPARPGDWIVTNHATGETQTMTNEEFTLQFAPMAIPSHMDPTQPEYPTPTVEEPVAEEPELTTEDVGPPALEDQPSTAPEQVRTTEPGPVEPGEESLATEPAIEAPAQP